MTDHQLAERARNAGITPEYRDWEGRLVAVPAETLTAILAVLEQSPPPSISQRQARDALAAPPTRQWGFTVQLYSLRSAGSWGHGDLHDLAELARWSAAELGAGFVLINPLHAAEPLPPVSASPYLPMTRLFTSPLYLRVEDIPEYGLLPAARRQQIGELAGPLRVSNTTSDLIDRDEVWQAKREALQLISQVPLRPDREADYGRFLAERGSSLRHWSLWCALAERYGPDWRDWQAGLADPAAAERLAASDLDLSRAAGFHSWLQWHADQQLAAAQDAARTAGMAHGIIHDLAVGVHPGGADAWAHQGELVSGFSVGAPPDGFNQIGQDWAQPPWHPGQLAAAGYRPLAELFAGQLRHAGGIRVDHVMGLMRLWWVPAGQRPDRGAYVRYDHEASVAALTQAAASAGALAIGEDLGTVDPWIRDYLAGAGILGTEALWFAADKAGRPLPPERWRRACMATVGTHDMPTVAGFRSGEQVRIRARLGLLTNPEERERASLADLLARWHAALVASHLLPPGELPDAAELTVALYGYLRRTPALLIGVSLADAVGEVRTQNVPGTSTEYPNWRIPLCDELGRALLLEDLPDSTLLQQVCEAVRDG